MFLFYFLDLAFTNATIEQQQYVMMFFCILMPNLFSSFLNIFVFGYIRDFSKYVNSAKYVKINNPNAQPFVIVVENGEIK